MLFRFFNKRTDHISSSFVRKRSNRIAPDQKAWQTPGWLDEARKLPHGAALDDKLVEALQGDLRDRTIEAGVGSGWPQLALSELRVRKDDLPEWWTSHGNLLLTGPNSEVPFIPPSYGFPLPTDAVIALGTGVSLAGAFMARAGGIAAFGDHCWLPGVRFSVADRSTIVVGERTVSAFGAKLDARNGGAIVIGAEGLWADGLFLATDDSHSIRDLQTGKRINLFGGRIVVERHVWFGNNVNVLGDSWIGSDTVIGMNAFVKNSVLPRNSVCVGQPARPIRTGTTWSDRDEP